MRRNQHSAKGLTYIPYSHLDEWVGSAEELVGAGVVQRRLLPGEPGNNKTSMTYRYGTPVRKGQTVPRDEGYLSIQSRGARYVVKKWLSEAEKTSRQQMALEQQERERDIRKRQAHCELHVQLMCENVESYRMRMRLQILVFSAMLEQGDGGYKFFGAIAEKMRTYVNILISLTENEKITYDHEARLEKIREKYREKGLEPPILEKQRPRLRLIDCAAQR